MNSISLHPIESALLESHIRSDEFYEFTKSIDELDKLFERMDPFKEAVENRAPSLKNASDQIFRNTLHTTADVATLYDKLTTSNANVIKSFWDLGVKAVSIIVKITSYILSKIQKIPDTIMGVLDAIIDLPGNIRKKIRGDIFLYITANDIDQLYNTNLFRDINDFLKELENLSEGEYWSKLFKPNLLNKKIKMNDMQACKRMLKIYSNLELLKFSKTSIPIADEATADIYFGKDHLLTFRGLDGKTIKKNYYDALILLVHDLNEKRDILSKLYDDLKSKQKESELNANFGKLDVNSQRWILTAIVSTSKVITIIGNIIRYIQIDMNTISKSLMSIKKKAESMESSVNEDEKDKQK